MYCIRIVDYNIKIKHASWHICSRAHKNIVLCFQTSKLSTDKNNKLYLKWASTLTVCILHVVVIGEMSIVNFGYYFVNQEEDVDADEVECITANLIDKVCIISFLYTSSATYLLLICAPIWSVVVVGLCVCVCYHLISTTARSYKVLKKVFRQNPQRMKSWCGGVYNMYAEDSHRPILIGGPHLFKNCGCYSCRDRVMWFPMPFYLWQEGIPSKALNRHGVGVVDWLDSEVRWQGMTGLQRPVILCCLFSRERFAPLLCMGQFWIGAGELRPAYSHTPNKTQTASCPQQTGVVGYMRCGPLLPEKFMYFWGDGDVFVELWWGDAFDTSKDVG